MTNKLKIAVVVLIVAAAALWFGLPRRSAAPGIQKTIVRPRIGDLERVISATAIIQPQNRLEMKPPVAGRVDRILVKEGQEVRAGETVAYLSSTERAALLDSAKSKDASTLEYWENIYKPIPLIAPIDGRVIVSTMQPGQSVTQADPVIVLSNRLIVQAQVDETDIGRVRAGQPAVILLDAYPDVRTEGVVDHIYHESTVVNNVTIYKVDILPNEVPSVFRSGMSATVQIVEESRAGVLLIPVDVVRQEKGASIVWVGSGSRDKPVQRRVELGMTDGTDVEVLAGIGADDVLIQETQKYVPSKAAGGTNPFAPQQGRRRPNTSNAGAGSGNQR